MSTFYNSFSKNSFFLLFNFLFIYYLLIPFGSSSSSILFFTNILLVFIFPSLVFLFGVQARNATREGFIHQAFIRFFIPYLIFQFLYSVGLSGTSTWFEPLYGMWLLLGLFFWHLLTPLFRELRHPILISFLLGITIPMINDVGDAFSLLRTFVFLPFFALGYYANNSFLDALNNKKSFYFLSIPILFIIGSLFFLPGELFAHLLSGGWNYNDLQLPYFSGALSLGFAYLLMITGTFVFFSLVPHKGIPFVGAPKTFIPIYILSLGGLFLLQESGWNENFFFWKVFLAPLIAISFYFLANSPWLKRVASPFTTGTIFLALEALFIVFKKTLVSIFSENKKSTNKKKNNRH